MAETRRYVEQVNDDEIPNAPLLCLDSNEPSPPPSYRGGVRQCSVAQRIRACSRWSILSLPFQAPIGR